MGCPGLDNIDVPFIACVIDWATFSAILSYDSLCSFRI